MGDISILIVDDTDAIRHLLRTYIDLAEGFELVAEATNGAEGVDLAGRYQPDAVILDGVMPVLHGLDTIVPLRQRSPRSKIVMWSSEPSFRDDALARGAHAFHVKDEPFDVVEATIRALLEA